jgi:hypothetical protein
MRKNSGALENVDGTGTQKNGERSDNRFLLDLFQTKIA